MELTWSLQWAWPQHQKYGTNTGRSILRLLILSCASPGGAIIASSLRRPSTRGRAGDSRGAANFPDGPPADFATRSAGRQETEDATSPITSTEG